MFSNETPAQRENNPSGLIFNESYFFTGAPQGLNVDIAQKLVIAESKLLGNLAQTKFYDQYEKLILKFIQ